MEKAKEAKVESYPACQDAVNCYGCFECDNCPTWNDTGDGVAMLAKVVTD